MWNLNFAPPIVIEARVLTRMPAELRRAVRTDWAEANKPGQLVDCFLEGPTFDANGVLHVTDIPHGRLFRITADGTWELVAETGGWPNGMALHVDGSLWIADYRRGLLRCECATGKIDTMLAHRNSEAFRGLNDLCFDARGNLYFTDQGQSGLHDPSGRVYRLEPDGRLDLVVDNVPSPNGIALTADGSVLFVAVTRANQVWRAPVMADGSISKMGAFRTFFGTSGPDGLATTPNGGLIVAHASLGGAFVLNARGEITHFIRSPAGQTVTNVAIRPQTSSVVMTESHSGSILEAELR
ncbi:SMP-30/gluconolactonase/LRE family protein [Variovorax rhizosphaerae]|uniref:SMP-30/gluconolactonase/LRE family protein n=1 Tax=Variovorax rhizosphaerae TaxID=1836200 RepID=A0ABU8WRT1_9BURK